MTMPPPSRCPRAARARRLAYVLLCLGLPTAVRPGTAVAQLAALPAPVVDGAEGGAPDTLAAARADSAEVPPIVTLPDPRWGAAIVDLGIANMVPWAYNRYVAGQSWARVSGESWSRNLRRGVEWDNNSFYANHFDHPYHGAMYYAAGRANGFSFGASSGFTLAGSALWEFLGETNVPSANDLLTTTLGGMVVGEVGWRASQLILDDGATGLDRFLREFVVVGINPGYGIHRLMRGQMWKVDRAAAPRGIPRHESSVDVGYRARGNQVPVTGGTVDQGTMRVVLHYGDAFAYERIGAFDVFDGRVEIGSGQPRILSELSANGFLAGGHLAPALVGGATMDYQLLATAGYEFSSLAFGGTLRARTATMGRWRMGGGLDLMASPITAVTSAYAAAAIARPYDLTAGMGLRATAYVDRGPVRARATYTTWLLVPVSAAADGHHVQLLSLEARVPIAGAFAVGTGYDLFVQSSRYGGDIGREVQSFPDVRFFVSRAGGFWR